MKRVKETAEADLSSLQEDSVAKAILINHTLNSPHEEDLEATDLIADSENEEADPREGLTIEEIR